MLQIVEVGRNRSGTRRFGFVMREFGFIAAAALLSSCNAKPPPEPLEPIPVAAPTEDPASAPSPLSTDTARAPLSVDTDFVGPRRPIPDEERLQAVAPGINAFGRDLYGVMPRGGNLVLSPSTLAFALGMQSLAARGKARAEFDAVLHRADAGLDGDAWHEAMGGLRRHWLRLHEPEVSTGADVDQAYGHLAEAYSDAFAVTDTNEQTRVIPANAVFAPWPHRIAPSFARSVEEHYGAGVFALDPTDPQTQVASWIAEATEGQIPDLHIDLEAPDLAAVLVSTTYFQGQWVEPFEASDTKDAVFYVDGTTPVRVPTIHGRKRAVRCGHTDTYARVELSMGWFDMIFVAPKARDGLAAAEAAWLDGSANALELQLRTVSFSVPKFDLAPTPTKMRPALEALGLRRAFDPNAPAFGGLGSKDAPGPAYLDQVVHAATITLDEEGVVAAAAVVDTDVWGGGVAPDGGIIELDRPFLFAIRERHLDGEGAVLFVGRITDPR